MAYQMTPIIDNTTTGSGAKAKYTIQIPLGHGRTNWFDIFEGVAEYDQHWAIAAGATHTLILNLRDPITNAVMTRAARLLKTCVYVAVDEADDGSTIWEKWPVRRTHRI